LTAALRAHAAGLLCAQAAVELLIGHAVWLRRSGFVDRFVTVEADPALVPHPLTIALSARLRPVAGS
jgi:hypothetical protein